MKFWAAEEEKDQRSWKEHSRIATMVPNVTALRFFPSFIRGGENIGMIVGLESGELSVWLKGSGSEIKDWQRVGVFEPF